MTSFSEPLVLPPPPEARRRGPLPILASIVPVVGGVAMWLMTGSLLGLCFAALGPFMAVASLVDGARTARRDRRAGERELAIARTRLEREMAARHAAEREALDARHPDAALLLQRPERVWRAVPGASDVLVIGRGRSGSGVRVVGGDEELRARAAQLDDAPVTIPLGAGVGVQGPEVIARAVLRALVVQLCLAHDPEAMAIVAVPSSEDEWSRDLPHRAGNGGPSAALRLAVVGPGEAVPAGADVALAYAVEGSALPARCGALITLTEPGWAELLWDGSTSRVAIECVSDAQARSVARLLALRAADAAPPEAGPVALAGVLQLNPASASGLAAAIGMDGQAGVVLDLVADGPHAVVAGVTGSGKSELLISWVTSLCAAYSTREVAFLLADFKGGTAFDALAALPHVTGVITDLDVAGSRRAVESLRAELRWREAELARAGARDILDPRVQMPRLVIVVDEFAAMLAEHPDLHAVFTDVASRGRALGMHLVLGTQRVSGVVRDALLANCPLRVSLRVTDAADSRMVVGTDDAARLPGGGSSRGMAYVRRAADVHPRLVRVALSSADDVSRIVEHRGGEPRPRRPWLPALPRHLRLEDLSEALTDRGHGGSTRLGLADDPERQRQEVVAVDRRRDRGLVVIGGPGSGKTGVIDLIAAQNRDAIRVPRDPERAWDALHTALPPGAVVLVDDVDALVARLPADHARAVLDRLEGMARDAAVMGTYLVLTAQRLNGSLARVVEPLPSR
ncbi:MAG TPA: FtsK/SpoIIIE domain-containing protein, partial [Microbacterium sp.]|uniref:FtsK/SpoIIIE domain-containing protein n=1 Tax=Microbacterium sp. TaxID=51671 RepID=UPI002C34E07B